MQVDVGGRVDQPNSNGSLLWLLALGTLIIVIVIAVWQRMRVAKSKDEHTHSAMTSGRPDQRKSDGSDPGTKAQ